ncbi:murein biosynthesis integral membrane protein MurJ [Ureibacillus thermosphaericus]|uniref:murein biosynthesis integral membrane protein MurJ n=1 Tax=Ureibacillus thermosphaericus TaxID=51173 RepID=UPI000BBC261B|nr:murein biosynthesis integral membrane protein MurJ [Ureibacillus thermosphaericus]
MKKAAFLIIILTIVVKGLGFIRDIVISYYYGASYISDAYLLSLTIPTFFFSFISMGITTGFIPTFTKIADNTNETQAISFTNNLTNVLLFFCTLIIVIGIIFTEPIVKIFAIGFEGETLRLAVDFTRIGFITLYFYVLTAIYSGYLQIKGDFATPVLVGFPMNIITMIVIFISTKTSLVVLAYGSVLAAFSQILLWLPAIIKKGYKYKFTFNIKDKNLKEMFVIAIPAIIALNINQINVLIDRTLASTIAPGAMSSIDYANRLNIFMNSLFAGSIATVLYPTMAKMALKKDKMGLNSSMQEALNIVTIITVPLSVGMIIFSEQIIQVLFGRGAFDRIAIYMTSQALLYYSIGISAYGFREILSRAFYAITDTKTPLINSVYSMILNICLNFILLKYLGIGGLALSTSLSAIFMVILLSINYNKKIVRINYKPIIVTLLKCSIASILMGLSTLLIFEILSSKIILTIALIISVVIGVILYLLLIYLFKVRELYLIILLLKSKLNQFHKS